MTIAYSWPSTPKCAVEPLGKNVKYSGKEVAVEARSATVTDSSRMAGHSLQNEQRPHPFLPTTLKSHFV